MTKWELVLTHVLGYILDGVDGGFEESITWSGKAVEGECCR